MITLYSTHCPKCKVLEKKLAEKDIEFTVIDNIEEVVEFGKTHDKTTAPLLDTGDAVLEFTEAVRYLNTK